MYTFEFMNSYELANDFRNIIQTDLYTYPNPMDNYKTSTYVFFLYKLHKPRIT